MQAEVITQQEIEIPEEKLEKSLDQSITEEKKIEEPVEVKEVLMQIPFEESDFPTRLPHQEYQA